MARAFVEQLDDVRVELVNGLAMVGNVHGQGRMMNDERRIKSVCWSSGFSLHRAKTS
jgi:hypothetical protein